MSTEPKLPLAEPCDDSPGREECKKIRAERWFDKAVYGGISYAAQAGTGIGLLFWMAHTKSGQKVFKPIIEWLGKNFISKITSKRGEVAEGAARYWFTVSTMVMVGNLFLIPVKWLEDRKPKAVRWINDRIRAREEARGYKITPEERELEEKRLTQMEHEPKQTWWSLGLGRVFGLAAVYTVLPLMGDYNKIAEKWTSSTITKGIDKIGLKTIAKSKSLRNFLDIGFYDVFYSMVSAGGLYIYSHFIRPPKKKGEINTKQEILATAVDTAMMAANLRYTSAPGTDFTNQVQPSPASHVQKLATESEPSLHTSL